MNMKLFKRLDKRIEQLFLGHMDLFRLDLEERFLITSEILQIMSVTDRVMEYIQIIKKKGKLFILESLISKKRVMHHFRTLLDFPYKSTIKIYGYCSCCKILPITIEGVNECAKCMEFSHHTLFNPFVQSLDRQTIKSLPNGVSLYTSLSFGEKEILASKYVKSGKLLLTS